MWGQQVSAAEKGVSLSAFHARLGCPELLPAPDGHRVCADAMASGVGMPLLKPGEGIPGIGDAEPPTLAHFDMNPGQGPIPRASSQAHDLKSC